MKLNEYMPPFLRNVREFNEIFKSEDVEIDEVKYQIDKMLTEVIVKTADSYGLERYEKIYGIRNKLETIEARRMNILFKINNRIPYTLKWLINTLNESIGVDNYKLVAKNYELYITINLAYTEAAEMLKSNLIKQIPANIKLDYELQTELNEFIGLSISSQDYISLNAVAFERKENLLIKENNNIGLSVINEEYLDLNFNTDTKVEQSNLNLNTETGLNVSRQDYMNLITSEDEKQENITLNQNNNIGFNIVNQNYIEIKEE